MAYTEARSSISSSPKHCRNWPPGRRLVIRHRCHFVKQRLRLATQTVIGLLRIERAASAKSSPNASAHEVLAGRPLARLMLHRPERRIAGRQPRSSRVKFVALGPKLVYLRIVLGGTAASHTCSGVGGGHFLIKEVGSQTYNRTAGSNLGGSFIFDLICGGQPD